MTLPQISSLQFDMELLKKKYNLRSLEAVKDNISVDEMGAISEAFDSALDFHESQDSYLLSVVKGQVDIVLWSEKINEQVKKAV